MLGLHGMQNGGRNGEKLKTKMENSPQLHRAKMAKEDGPKVYFRGSFHIFSISGNFLAILVLANLFSFDSQNLPDFVSLIVVLILII